jgi:PKD repeat protein
LSASAFATIVVVTAVVLAPVASIAPAAAESTPPVNGQFAVAQGTSCTVVSPVTNTSQTVQEFYDYRNPESGYEGSEYSSYGTVEYQEAETSVVLFYTGANGTSLVTVNNRLGGGGGSTVTMQFSGLPADGNWDVQDDLYPGQDDDWVIGETATTVDWKWAGERTDGGAYTGFGSFDGTTVIEPGFNEDAAHWDDWDYSNYMDAWVVKGADGTSTSLDMDRRVFVHGGDCLETPPDAAVSGPEEAETGANVTFDAGATTDDEAVGGYEWDFDGDGAVDEITTEASATHAYSETGNYTATVTAFDTYGNGDTATTTVSVTEPGSPPDATLDAPSDATANESITLDASGSSDEGSITEFQWDFEGDGTQDATTSSGTVEPTYTESGEMTPEVTVVDDDSETETASTTVTVESQNSPPSAALDVPATAAEGESVTLDAGDSTDDSGIASFRWDFEGDGEVDDTTTGSSVSHTYTAGNYTPTVTVVDGDGGQDSASASIAVEAASSPPNAVLDAPSETTVNESTTLDASGSSDEGSIAEFRWDFDGDGTVDQTTTSGTVEHTYTESGETTPEVTVVDEDNATAADSATVTVRPPNSPPEATLDAPSTADAGEEVTLDASGSTDDRGIASFRWDFEGDGEVDTTTESGTVTHTYAEGNYTPTVTVVDSDDATDAANASIEVQQASSPPNAVLDAPAEATVNESVTLDASASADEGSIAEFRWDFDGDGTVDQTTTSGTVEHTYTQTGDVTTAVTVVDDDSATAADSATVTVSESDPALTAELSVGTEGPAVDESVSFDGSASTPADDIVSYEWTFGDGENATGQAVEHAYESAGTYTVTLEVASSDGDVATAEETLVVQADDSGNDGGDGDDGGNNNSGNDAGGNNGGNDAGGNNGGTNNGANNAGGTNNGGAGGNNNAGGPDNSEEPTDPAAPDIGAADVSFADETLVAGDSLTVEATLTNDGDAAGERAVEFVVNGTVVENRTVNLTANESETVTFTRQLTTPGSATVSVDGTTQTVDVQPAEPDISVARVEQSTDSVLAGETFDLSAYVQNTGTAEGATSVELELFGEVVDTKHVTVPAGETREVTFTRQIQAPGSYTASVGNATVSLEVASEDTTTTSDTTTTTGDSSNVLSPGFGPAVAVLALALAAAGRFAWRRKE